MMIQSFGRDKDCLKIWESLKAAFIHKNPCNATTKDYQPLMELASHPVPCNKVTARWAVQGGLLRSNVSAQCSEKWIFSIVTVSRWT